MKKKILIGAGIGLVVVIIAAVVVVSFFLGDVVKAGMETIGPKVTQTTLTVNSVDVSVLTGSAGVNSLVLGNPEGYKSTNAISVGKAAVSIAPMSVLADKVVIHSVEVRDAVITFEGNPVGANNLKQIMANVDAFTGSGTASTTNAPAQTGTKKAAKKLEVDDFLITGAKVNFNGTVLTLPDIHLTDLGTGPDGITPVALIKEVLGRITTTAIKTVASSPEATKAIQDEAGKLSKSIGGLFKK